jgi:putative MATE family efflux protein
MGFSITLSLSVALLFTLGTSLIPENLISVFSRDPWVIEAGAAYLRYLSPSFIPFALSKVLVLTLRSVERIRLAIGATFVSLSLNTILNYFFILGAGPIPGLGVRGAGIAVTTARYTEMLILIIGCYVFRYPPAGKFKEIFSFNSAYAVRYLRVCLPVIFNEIIWSTGISVQNVILARSSTEAIAAYSLTNTVSQLTWMILIGLANGVAVLIGKKIGEGKEKEARDYAFRFNRFIPLVSLGAVAILLPISRLLPYIINSGPEVTAASALMFIILSCAYPFKSINMGMVLICRAGGDTVFCALYEIVPMWLISVSLGAAAAFLFSAPAHIIFLCFYMEEPVKAALGLWRLKTGKWLHNVVK